MSSAENPPSVHPPAIIDLSGIVHAGVRFSSDVGTRAWCDVAIYRISTVRKPVTCLLCLAR